MEDDKLKQLFADFDPAMSLDSRFMSQLRNNMEAVELIQQRNLASRRHNKIAVVAAALSGLVTGVLLTILMPFAIDWLSNINISIPLPETGHISLNPRILAWITASMVSTATVFNTYKKTVSLLSAKRA